MHSNYSRGQRGDGSNIHGRSQADKGPRYCSMQGMDVFYCEHHNAEACLHSCNYKGGGFIRRQLARGTAAIRGIFGRRSP